MNDLGMFNDSLPGFWGTFGVAPEGSAGSPEALIQGAPIWALTRPFFQLHVGRAFQASLNAWNNPDTRGQRPSVFVTGSLYLGDDAGFGTHTRVSSLELSEAPARIADLYEKHGPDGFAYLDGEFNIVLSDPRSGAVYLATDRCGSHDIYFRQEGDVITFGSHPLLLCSPDERFDPQSISFYLAHEGFFPSPFTVSPRVQGVGRARFLRIALGSGRTLERQAKRYGRPTAEKIGSRKEADDTLHRLLKDATRVRSTDNCAVLLSGGVDSSLLVNLAASNPRTVVTVTGTVKGWVQGEREVGTFKKLAEMLSLEHHAVVLDPHDDSLPDEYAECAMSWMNGSRLTLPLWRRYAARIRENLGDGYRVVAGQTADTLADNNYTLPSMGYTMRRALFSSWMLKMSPAISTISPRPGEGSARLSGRLLSALGGGRGSSHVWQPARRVIEPRAILWRSCTRIWRNARLERRLFPNGDPGRL